jgi:integrase
LANILIGSYDAVEDWLAKGLKGRDPATATTNRILAEKHTLNAYVVLSLMTGIRTEEARALRWDHVVAWTKDAGWQPVTDVGFDHKKFAIYVWRSVREHGDTKTELRQSFVSIMSDNGVPIETIADLVGHAGTAVTEKVYRHQLKPVITKGAETMNTSFKSKTRARSA